ncbi:MAG TPA: aminotransferase class V-fold PLP-dependent enzyme, partial [Candidatus Sulfotelmatobacter sp.]|nr:aminotransferase class V-fold PLP-dependent enzyme [Candidatus Sulfotelmatobacter sp.]
MTAVEWLLEPDLLFLNHGSFGACPRIVLEAQQAWRDRLEAEPVRFLARELETALDGARAVLGGFVGADPDDLAFVPNATHGVNTVLRSLRFAPGDELLTDDHAYHACRNALRAAADRSGATLVVAHVPFPTMDPDEVHEAVLAAVTSRTRLALISHVTSPTALIFPVAGIAAALAARGVEVLVDGAHAPGMVPLDIRALEAAGVAYYTGNAHKWLCAPKGSGFLWVRRDRQADIHPLAISHGADSPRRDRSRFRLEFDWTGTADPSACLAIPAAIEAMGSVLQDGWPGLMAANHAAVVAGRLAVLDRLGLPAPAPAGMLGSMASLILPAADPPVDDAALQAALLEGWRIEVPVFSWPESRDDVTAAVAVRRIVRISAQVYVAASAWTTLADALAESLE